MRLIDSHCHIDSPDFDGDRDAVVARATAAGVEHMILVGLWRAGEGTASAERALRVAAAHRALFSPSVGIHPHDVAAAPKEDWSAVDGLCRRPEVVAVGETGLDYHYDHSPRDAQAEGFRHFIRVAQQTQKPLIIHTREADQDTCRALDEVGVPKAGAVIHCFTGGRAAARAYLDRGLWISFSGILTFKAAEELREAAKLVPLERLLVETDAPYLAPVPHRGRRNEPAFVARTLLALAQVRGIAAEELAETTVDNARRFFRLSPGVG